MTRRRTPAALTALAVLALPSLAACGSGDGSSGAVDGRPQVVTSFYALQYLAERIGGDRVDVTNLTSPGQEPHDLELGLQGTAALSDADVVVYESGFQPAVDEAIDQESPARVVDATDAADLVPFDGDHSHEHDDHADETGDDHADEDHADEGELDPHFWTDPVRMAAVAEEVEAELADADPDGASTYAANLDALRGDLQRLDREYHDGLRDCAISTVVVSHDAFGYLSGYGLDFQGIAGLSPDAEPTPSRLAELQDLIESDGITTVFYESLVSPEIAETLAGDAGVQAATLDPIEGLSDETSGEDYLSLMRSNLAALEKANECR